ncbi:MAG: hypothetical protein AUJ01_14080 [Acidobacteria bacterium 13_1_40CM_3_65_5]|nr:MAG: hypothetical protein AUJ01_14080 [Acidobacteria bacterium 13_1_40CM_3_65_5]
MSVLTSIVGTTDLTILVYFLVLNSFYAVLLVLSIPEIWEQTRLAEDEDFQRLMQSDALPPITMLVPAYNESATIEASVTAILTLEYRNYEVVVVNDGSNDDTMEQLRHAFDLYEIPRVYPETIATKPLRALYRSRSRSRLLVLDKENGGKADSLNAAINASRFPLVIAIDADTLIEPDALLRLTRPFLLGRKNRQGRSRDRRPRAGEDPARHSGGGVSACVSVRPARLESAGRQSHHLRGVRVVSERVRDGDRRVSHHEHRRGPRSGRAAAPLSPRAQDPVRNALHSGPGRMDRSAGVHESVIAPT